MARLHDGERQRALSLRWDTRNIWPRLQAAMDVTRTGAAIAAALLAESRGAGLPISYSRRRAHFVTEARYRDPLYTYARIVPEVDRFEARGWIFHDRAPPGRLGRQSAMIATPLLIETMEHALRGTKMMIARPREPIILRNEEGAMVGYSDTPERVAMRRRVEAQNEAIRGTDISGDLSAPIVRIWNEGWDRGGRAYALGGGWQSLPAEMRALVQIDGEPVVEIDFDCMHGAMLYGRAGKPMPSDCYRIGHWPRAAAKRAFFILINATTASNARMAVAHKVILAAEPELQINHAIAKAARLIQDIKEAHAPIASAFHSDAGAGLMLEDSMIADRVMLQMRQKAVVVLPVHDSFLVQKSKAGMLEEAMIAAAYRAGFPHLKVSRK